MAGLLDVIKEKAKQQYQQGLLNQVLTNPASIGTELSQLFDPQYMSQVNPMTQESAMDVALSAPMMAGTIKNVGKTAFETAQEVAQRNAALPVSKGGLGLPATNTAMDRAKAMGFDVNNPVYHGTSADISAFNPALSDSARKTGTPSGSMVVSSNPKTANTYTQGYVGDFTEEYLNGGNILPLYIRKGKNLSINAAEPNYTPNWNDIYNPKYPDISTTNEFANLAKLKGKDSATIKNVKDNARSSSAEGDTTFLFNPNLIRSRFAAFDPFRRNEADILAGVAAAPIGLLTDNKKKDKKK